MTFLEVVFAAGLLGAAAATVTSAFSTILRFSASEDTRLAASEVAHRLILQFLDDPAALHPETDVFPMGRSAFRYLVNKQVLAPEDVGVSDEVTKRAAVSAATSRFEDKLKAKLLMVTVEVYEDRGAKPSGEPLATISRIYNPLEGAEDDPDAFSRHVVELFSDDPAMQALLRAALQSGRTQQQQVDQAKADERAKKEREREKAGETRKKPRRVGEGQTP